MFIVTSEKVFGMNHRKTDRLWSWLNFLIRLIRNLICILSSSKWKIQIPYQNTSVFHHSHSVSYRSHNFPNFQTVVYSFIHSFIHLFALFFYFQYFFWQFCCYLSIFQNFCRTPVFKCFLLLFKLLFQWRQSPISKTLVKIRLTIKTLIFDFPQESGATY